MSSFSVLFVIFFRRSPITGGVITSSLWGPSRSPTSRHPPEPPRDFVLRLLACRACRWWLLLPLPSRTQVLLLLDNAFFQESESCKPSSQRKYAHGCFCVQLQGTGHLLIKVQEVQVKDPLHKPYTRCFETWRFMLLQPVSWIV